MGGVQGDGQDDLWKPLSSSWFMSCTKDWGHSQEGEKGQLLDLAFQMTEWVWEKVEEEAEGSRGRACLFKSGNKDSGALVSKARYGEMRT